MRKQPYYRFHCCGYSITFRVPQMAFDLCRKFRQSGMVYDLELVVPGRNPWNHA